MKRVLNFSKNMFTSFNKNRVSHSPVIWQRFAIIMLILGVILPATLQAQTNTKPNETLITDMGTFIVERQNNESDKQALIFIPGLMSNPTVYDGIKEAFYDQFDVHTLAIKGFAGTPQDGEFNFGQLLNELQSYIEMKKLNKPHIIGHSMGGLIGLSMAAEQELVTGKVISIDGLPFIGPIFTRSNDTQVSQIEPQARAMKNMFAQMKPEQLAEQTKRGIFIQAAALEDQEYIIQMALNSDPVTAGIAMYEVMTRDVRQTLQSSETHILMLGASGAFTQEAQYQAAQSLYEQQFENVKHAKVIMNTKARHFIMYDQPTWLLEQVRSFLEE